jgi:hypothetical protein
MPKQCCTDKIQKLARSSDDKKLHVETKDNNLSLGQPLPARADLKIYPRRQRAIKPPEFCGGR